jgi:hypothetical protein
MTLRQRPAAISESLPPVRMVLDTKGRSSTVLQTYVPSVLLYRFTQGQLCNHYLSSWYKVGASDNRMALELRLTLLLKKAVTSKMEMVLVEGVYTADPFPVRDAPSIRLDLADGTLLL